MTVNISFMYYRLLLIFYGFGSQKVDFFILFSDLFAVCGDTKLQSGE